MTVERNPAGSGGKHAPAWFEIMKWRLKVGSKPIITLTTDFGLDDPFVGMMKAVILSIAPEARIVDLTHGIRSHDVMEAALVIRSSYSYFPRGSIHVVVVDPGVGSQRRPLLATTENGYFIAPDNGVLSEIYAGSSPVACVELTASKFFQHPVSQTFHGRDIFSPVAAWLSRGIQPERFGKPVREVVRLRLPPIRQLGRGRVGGTVLRVDKFGNLVTNIRAEGFKDLLQQNKFRLQIGGRWVDRLCSSYAEAQGREPFAIWGSFGLLELSCNQDSAAKRLQVGPYDEFEIDIG